MINIIIGVFAVIGMMTTTYVVYELIVDNFFDDNEKDWI